MDHPLVVLDGSEQEGQLVRESLALAAGVDARIEFLALFTPGGGGEHRQEFRTTDCVHETGG